ncbi:hypothetical protein ACFE04_017635 [Oxalis oulophora]
MANSSDKSYTLFLLLNLYLISSCMSVSLNVTRFEQNLTNIVYIGDAQVNSDGSVDLPTIDIPGHTAQVIAADNVRLWDAKTGNLSDFKTHFTFMIETQVNSSPAAGITFFFAPAGFEFPLNSNGGFLGLFNTSKGQIPRDQIVMVEFDTFWNEKWDPADVKGHVGINNNSIASSVHTAWNISLHDRDIADVWITYLANTKNLTVEWKYQKTDSSIENSSLSMEIDLRQSLPEWVMVGFSAATCASIEKHILLSWEFISSLESKTSQKSTNRTLIIVVSVAGSIIVLIAVTVMVLKRKWKAKTENSENILKVTSIDNDDLNKGPRRFSYQELVTATKDFSADQKLGKGGFGTVYRGFLPDINMEVAVKKISRSSKQGKKEYMTEIKIISQLRHRNLVKLIGWCHEKSNLLLVYELMPNGSLDSHLFRSKRTPLTWEVRYKTALGRYAAGHMEEKPNNGLVGSVWDLYGNGKLHSGVDDKLKMNFDKNQAERLLTVGLWCAHPDFRQRPSIRQAIQVLKFEADKPVLPNKMPLPTYEIPVQVLVEPVGSHDEDQPSSGSITVSSILIGR